MSFPMKTPNTIFAQHSLLAHTRESLSCERHAVIGRRRLYATEQERPQDFVATPVVTNGMIEEFASASSGWSS
jgi:hypothetical protein